MKLGGEERTGKGKKGGGQKNKQQSECKNKMVEHH